MAKQAILLTGSNGQLGKTFQAMWSSCELASSHDLRPLPKDQLDITQLGSVQDCIAKINPVAVINCSAYTAVDKAESDVAHAFLVNEQGPENLAKVCAANNLRLIHVSTDFVFSGEFDQPIAVGTPTIPAGVYGASKRAGEMAILKALPDRAAIFRTSWLYSPYNANFVKTMLKLMAERESLSVVADQRGAPTSAAGLVDVLMRAAADSAVKGLYHWSDKGDISWYDFAVEIQAQAVALGLLTHAIPINPIKTSDYPTAATRPAYSVLDCSKTAADLSVKQQNWQDELSLVLQQLKTR